MKIYLMRHGKTEYNKKALIQGSSDISLCAGGRSQARYVRNVIKKLNINHVYSGSLIRQVETAKIACKDLDVDFNELVEFNEINFGEFEKRNSFESFDVVNKRLNINLKFFGQDDASTICDSFKKADTTGTAEDSNSMYERFSKGISIIESRYQDNENILIVSSGMAIGCYVNKIAPDFKQLSIKNCSICLIEKNNDEYKVESVFGGVDLK